MNEEELRGAKMLKEQWKRCEVRKQSETRTHHLRCPKCEALAFNLWMISGLTYFKCDACGHKTENL